MIRRLLSLACVASLALALTYSTQAPASQGSGCMPTTGTISGLTFAQDVNAAVAALISSNSGASAPATDCTAVAIKGQIWLDTSSTPNVLKQYDGTSWITIGTMDSTNHIWTPPIGGGTNSIVSASTVDLGSVAQAYISVTGATGPITSFGSSAVAGTLKVVVFASTPTITYNATSMILPSGVDLTAAAGDVWVVAHLGSGNWRVISTSQASGAPILNAARDLGDIWLSFAASAPAKSVLAYGQALTRSSYTAFVAATTVVQTGNRTNGSAIITALSDTGQLGAGMPIEGTGVPAATTILSVDSSTQVTMSANASSTGTAGSLTFFPNGYGASGSSSTIGVPDCRGVTLAGRSNMGGTNNGNYTTTYAGKNGQALGSTFGTESQTLTSSQIPATGYTFTGSTSLASTRYIDFINTSQQASSGSGTLIGGQSGSANGQPSIVPLGTVTVSGGGNPHPHMNPTRIANCFVRVLP